MTSDLTPPDTKRNIDALSYQERAENQNWPDWFWLIADWDRPEWEKN